MITEELQNCLQGIIPSAIATCSKEGIPNITILSQVYQVDDTHVAISNQFFSKTITNLLENPYATVQLMDPSNCMIWILELEFEREVASGSIFEAMTMQLEVIASMSGMTGVFKLQSAMICRILSVTKLSEAVSP